jgi:hypothetical protein
MPDATISLTVSDAEISSCGRDFISVRMRGVGIDEVVGELGVDELLEEVGPDAAKKYFDLVEPGE